MWSSTDAPKSVEKAIADIHKTVLNASLSCVAADLATAAGPASLVAQVKIADILVNNIGSLTMKPFAELADEDWAWLFDLNVMSGVRLTRHYLPGMVERGWTASLMPTSSFTSHALEPSPLQNSWTSSLRLVNAAWSRASLCPRPTASAFPLRMRTSKKQRMASFVSWFRVRNRTCVPRQTSGSQEAHFGHPSRPIYH
jgi:short-subunit dehydrogenase